MSRNLQPATWADLGRVVELVEVPPGLPRVVVGQLNVIMRIFAGDAPVVLRVEEDGKVEDLLLSVKVEPTNAFEQAVRALGGGLDATVFRRRPPATTTQEVTA